jgi:hypothetical protein
MSNYTNREVASMDDGPSFKDEPQRHPPSEFLKGEKNGTPIYEVPKNIEEIAAKRGWTYARYKTRHSGGFNGSPSLLMIYVPGDRYSVVSSDSRRPPVTFDQWINITLPYDRSLDPLPKYGAGDTGTDAIGENFTIVSLEHAKRGQKAEVMMQMFRYHSQSGGFVPSDKRSSVDGCYSCHPNGLRAISPLGYHVRNVRYKGFLVPEAQLPLEVWRAVTAMNDAMDSAAGDKAVTWGGIKDPSTGEFKPYLRPESYWPTWGPAKPTNGKSRSREFILGDGTNQGCATKKTKLGSLETTRLEGVELRKYDMSDKPNIDWQKIANAMNCESCHNNVTRGAINNKSSQEMIQYKIVVDQSMPFGVHLNPLDQGDNPNVRVQETLVKTSVSHSLTAWRLNLSKRAVLWIGS